MKEFLRSLGTVAICLIMVGFVWGASQEKFDLPEPYLGWEKAYLKEFPQLQEIMDRMVTTTAKQLAKPQEDILHNRVCSALAFRMARDLPKETQKLTIAADLLHNISKEEKDAVLTSPNIFENCGQMIVELKKRGYFKTSPKFWMDEKIIKNPKVGGNRALIHHITGAWMAGEMIGKMGGFSREEIDKLKVAIIEHSTGYWYFRTSVNTAVGAKESWQVVFPEPANEISRIAHDADLISQFVPESVVPAGSKWRVLAAKRWGAKNPQEEGHIVYYVFWRLFEEAKTKAGKEMAREKWEEIKPALLKLMNLNPNQDPVKVLGVPKIFQ